MDLLISKLKNEYPHIKDTHKLYSIGNIFNDNSQTYIYKIKKSEELIIEFYSYVYDNENVIWRKENTNITLKVIELKFIKVKNEFFNRYHVSDKILNSINFNLQ